ncbi:hypothetical protein C0992_005260 [Termitomyces sp. T32_za158]|nr:hypothetical protein C0992_005260 [Termitomyces sp. T32_za158]
MPLRLIFSELWVVVVVPLWSVWLVAHEEGWPLGVVYKVLGGCSGVQEIVEDGVSGSEEEEEDKLDEESLEGGDGVVEGEEGMQGVTERVSELEVVGGPSVVVLGKRWAQDEDEGGGTSEDGTSSFKRP